MGFIFNVPTSGMSEMNEHTVTCVQQIGPSPDGYGRNQLKLMPCHWFYN